MQLLHFLNNRCTVKESDSASQVSTEYGYSKGKHLKPQTLVLFEDRFVHMKCRMEEVK